MLISVLFAENMSSLVRHMFTPGRMNPTRAVFTNYISPATHIPPSITHNNLPSSLLNLPISSSLLCVASIHTSAVVERARQSTRKILSNRCVYDYRLSKKSHSIYILYVQEVVTLYLVTYYIKWVTTSWTDGSIHTL